MQRCVFEKYKMQSGMESKGKMVIGIFPKLYNEDKFKKILCGY